MMNHYAMAEGLCNGSASALAEAQVHATLALHDAVVQVIRTLEEIQRTLAHRQ